MSETTAPVDTPKSDPLTAGREALGRHAWQEAWELLSQADREGELSGEDLEDLAEVAFFSAHADQRAGILERAFKVHFAAGNEARAAYLALALAETHGRAGRISIATGWLKRAERLLDGKDEGYVHGYLALAQSELARTTGDIDRALELAERAVQIGQSAANPDLKASALSGLGALKIATGETSDGFSLMEEASFAAVNGELSPITTGVTTCSLIAACRDLTDYRRASEWTKAAEQWCQRESVSGFPGVCRVHRAEVVAMGGAWDQAELELTKATAELEAYDATPPQADGFYAIGEIRRLKGDYEGAEAALREAHARGRTPQPALALIRLAEGKVKAATAGINSAVDDVTWDQWARARLLPAQVEIAIAADDPVRARAAADELSGIVESYPLPALEAGKHTALGRVLIAEGDPTGAARELRSAIRFWREVVSPYEVARTQVLLARALQAVDDDDDADLELKAALAEFERLGAAPDAAAVARQLKGAADRRAAPAHIHKTFMFTDIVGSTNLAEALGDEAWENLLRWHDDMLRTLVARSGGEVVNSTGDGFFVAFESAGRGIECAQAIQRALVDHRRTSGFALSVRIGLHTAEANRRGADYSGVGVHLAARVAALAGGGEILATEATLAEAGDVEAGERRSATVKGVSAPVDIASVTWD